MAFSLTASAQSIKAENTVPQKKDLNTNIKSASSSALPTLILGKQSSTNVSTTNGTNTYGVIWQERAIKAKRAMIATAKNDKQTSSN